MRIGNAMTVRTEQDLRAAVGARGPTVIVAKVAESVPTVKPVRDYVFIKRQFMAAIGVPEC